MANMKLMPTKISGVYVVQSNCVQDSRGRFSRAFCDHELKEILGARKIVQINHSVTVNKGVVRGFHYQLAPYAEMKFVRCLHGLIWDVAVDLREQSPTFLQWVGVELSPESNNMLVIPEGCAHGFQTLEDNCEMLYLHTAPYVPSAEGGVRYDEPKIQVKWPITVTEVSTRDQKFVAINNDFRGLKP